MEAIAASMDDAEAAELSLAAGVDLVMLSSLSDAEASVERVMESVSAERVAATSITDSFFRVMRTRGLDLCELADT